MFSPLLRTLHHIFRSPQHSCIPYSEGTVTMQAVMALISKTWYSRAAISIFYLNVCAADMTAGRSVISHRENKKNPWRGEEYLGQYLCRRHRRNITFHSHWWPLQPSQKNDSTLLCNVKSCMWKVANQLICHLCVLKKKKTKSENCICVIHVFLVLWMCCNGTYSM